MESAFRNVAVRPYAEVDRLNFEDFYAAEFDRVLRSTFAFCGDRDVAFDAAQDAFAKAFVRWRRLSKEQWAGGWVSTTAMNGTRRRLRKTRAALPLDAPAPARRVERLDIVSAL